MIKFSFKLDLCLQRIIICFMIQQFSELTKENHCLIAPSYESEYTYWKVGYENSYALHFRLQLSIPIGIWWYSNIEF